MLSTSPAGRPRVLCVDDEPQVLHGLMLQLHRRFEVVTAPDGPSALALLATHGPFAVVCSDMRMPGMDGATLLKAVRETAPDATRLLLTGQADLDTAVSAINDGRIFRFLTKPCPPALLLDTFAAAVEQNRLVLAERELLEHTVRGSIKAMTDLLALASPGVFGRAQRIRTLSLKLAHELALAETWPLEVAALLCQAGAVALAPQTLDKLQRGAPLSLDEETQVARMPIVAEDLLGEIPRLEPVRAILAGARARAATGVASDTARREVAPLGGRILRCAIDCEHLQSHGTDDAVVVSVLRNRPGTYDRETLDALDRVLGTSNGTRSVREVPLAHVQVGMTLADDLFTTTGILVASRGYPVTGRFIERVRNAAPGSIREPVLVTLDGSA